MTRSSFATLVSLLLSIAPLAAARAGDSYLLSVSSASGAPGESATVTVSLATGAEDAYGYEFEVCHDETLADIGLGDIEPTAAVDAAAFETHLVEATGTSWTAVGVDAVSPFLAGATHVLYEATYDLVAAGTCELTFCEKTIAISIQTATDTVVPVVEGGTLEISIPEFLRGDADGDGVVIPLLDGIRLLHWGFLGAPPPPCFDAADASDNGVLAALNDSIFLFQWGFVPDAAAPPDPGVDTCGPDVTTDGLGCAVPPPCPGEFAKKADERFLFAISHDSAAMDDVAMVSITLACREAESLAGYQFAVCYDDSLVATEPGNVVYGEDTVDHRFLFHSLRYEDAGFVLGTVAFVTPFEPLEVSGELAMYDVFFNTLSKTGTAVVDFCTSNELDVFPLLVTADLTPIVPQTGAGSIEVFDPESIAFLRGDANGNGEVGAIEDGVFLLRWGFLEATEPPCMDAADANDAGGVVAIIDALYLLNWGFAGGIAPPAPGTEACGTDPTADGVDCQETPDCP